MNALSIIEEAICDNYFSSYPTGIGFSTIMKVLGSVTDSASLQPGYEVITEFADWNMHHLARHMQEIVDTFNDLEALRSGI